jgi:hypothetical protein
MDKPDTIGGGETFISKRIGNDAPYIFRFSYDAYQGSNHLSFTYDRRDDGGEAALYDTDTATIQTGVWQHIAVTFEYGDASSIKLYINGDEKAGTWSAGTGNQIPSPNDANITIGRGKSDSGEVSLMAKLMRLEYIIVIYPLQKYNKDIKELI